MTMFIAVAGIACIAYAYFNMKRINNFKELLDAEIIESSNTEENVPEEESILEDVKSIKKQNELMEKELVNLRESEKEISKRLEVVERFFEEFTGSRRLDKSVESSDSQKFKELNAKKYDFEEKSLEEMVSETGLKKGELLLLKRLSKK